jgi:hypothetical protein
VDRTGSIHPKAGACSIGCSEFSAGCRIGAQVAALGFTASAAPRVRRSHGGGALDVRTALGIARRITAEIASRWRYTLATSSPAVVCSSSTGSRVILTKSIPIDAQDFVRRCSHDCRVGRYAKDGDYLEFLIAETGKTHQKLLEFLRVVDRRSGMPRYHAQADHIVPQAVWPILMPSDLCGPNRADGPFMHALSNLFWRGAFENQSHDQEAIRHILSEATPVSRQAPSKRQSWAKKWIEIFLLTKRDEALAFPGDLVNLSTLDKLPARGAGTNWMGGR